VIELHDGDVVRFGNTVWRLQSAAPAEATKINSIPGAPQVTAARQVPSDLPPAPPQAPEREPEPALQATTAMPTPQAAPAAPQPAAQPAAPSAQPVGPRGDVPPPPLEAPSAIRRVLPPDALSQPPAFSPSPARRVRGSAATRVEATLVAWLIVFAVFVAVTVYFATR
jgi:hypothetical protein